MGTLLNSKFKYVTLCMWSLPVVHVTSDEVPAMVDEEVLDGVRKLVGNKTPWLHGISKIALKVAVEKENFSSKL